MAPKLTEFDPKRRPIFVVGNEAADVDSLVSAFVLASVLDNEADEAIPLAQITREEFRLRGDAVMLFKDAGIEVGEDGSPLQMRFWDEVDWEIVSSVEKRGLVLTDHNKMTALVKEVFDGKVEMIVDHHADSNAYPDVKKTLDESVGSACTLVAEQLLAKPSPSKSHATLLAGVMLLDCRNFGKASEASKGTARDREALDKLKATLLGEVDETAWFDQLWKARYDVSGLTPRELLMLDMKAAPVEGFGPVQIAFSSMMGTLDSCISKAGGATELLEVIKQFAKDKGYQATVALFAKDEQKRKALVTVPLTEEQQPLCDAIVARLSGAPGNLPKALQENPLYEAQAILEKGFGLEKREDLSPLQAYFLRAEISRKTLLPRVCSEEVANSSL